MISSERTSTICSAEKEVDICVSQRKSPPHQNTTDNLEPVCVLRMVESLLLKQGRFVCGCMWVYVGVCVVVRMYVGVRVYMGVCECMWVYVGVFGCCGCMWVYVGVCGCMWVYVGVCGYVGVWMYVGMLVYGCM